MKNDKFCEKCKQSIKGNGIVNDIIEDTKTSIKNIKQSLLKPTLRYPRKSRNTLNKYGQYLIKNITIGRKPVIKALEIFLNLVSVGSYNKAKKQLPYDKLFHLFMILELYDPNTKNTVNILAEKNETINISTSLPNMNGAETQNILVRRATTLDDFLNNTVKKIGEEPFFRYSALQYNCQHWILSNLISNGYVNEEYRKFILQNIKPLIDNLKKTNVFMNTVTDSVAKIRQLTGLGERKPLLNENEFKF